MQKDGRKIKIKIKNNQNYTCQIHNKGNLLAEHLKVTVEQNMNATDLTYIKL